MHKNLLLLLVIIGFVSCDSNRILDEYVDFDNNVWLESNIVDFDIEITDTISRNNLFLNLRNNKDYEFSNLFLITQIHFPDGFRIVDTLEYEMADKAGRFLGVGFSDIKENKLFFKENVRFNQVGNYKISVAQAMRKNGNIKGLDSLKGVTDLGVRIELSTK
ncbi:MAG: gliding motility lipoprotein GldH [Flavobacteriaceae bacterium]|nr:gliding motility lipoprotein GldH [Flavobacteriaceae bacterium]